MPQKPSLHLAGGKPPKGDSRWLSTIAAPPQAVLDAAVEAPRGAERRAAACRGHRDMHPLVLKAVAGATLRRELKASKSGSRFRTAALWHGAVIRTISHFQPQTRRLLSPRSFVSRDSDIRFFKPSAA